MTERFIDFDAARAERAQEPLRLRAYGMNFELPASVPAAVLLDIMRLQADQGDDAEVSGTEALGILQRVLPESVLGTLLARDDFDINDFVELTGLVMAAYGNVGNPPAPNRAARRHPERPSQARGSRASSTTRKAKPAV